MKEVQQVCILLFPIIFMACSGSREEGKTNETVQRLVLYADEAFAPVLEAERSVFESLPRYHKAEVAPEFTSENLAVKAFIDQKTDIVLSGRKLNNSETEIFRQREITVHQHLFAYDGVALIVNDDFPDSVLSMDQLKSLFQGSKKRWNELEPGFPTSEILIISDRNNSSNLLLIKNCFGLSTDKANIFSAGSTDKVLEYVSEHPQSIGIIGANWFSDQDDHRLTGKQKKIRILGISERGQVTYPFQSHIADGSYPLKRPVYIIENRAHTGLAAAFVTFMLHDRGQKIVLKEGLVPANVPERDIEFKYE